MTHRILILALIVAGASSAGAQGPITSAKRAARNAASATNAHIAQETGQQVPQQPAPAAASQKAGAQTPAAGKPGAQKPANQTAAAPQDSSGANPLQQGAPADSALVAAVDSAAGDKPLIMREVFEYSPEGRRDPFVSLMKSRDLRPTMSDLRLTGVLFDLSGRRPIAILRDSVAGVQWRVTTGMSLGRMRIAAIRPKTVVFTIEEFGFSRQDSLVLGDTTRVRSK